MKHTLFLSMLAAVLMGSGVANAAGTLYASQYGVDYTSEAIELGNDRQEYDKLVVDTPLTLTGWNGYLDLYNGATLAFSKKNGAEAMCCIFTSEGRLGQDETVYFNDPGDVYNFTFDADAQAIIAASAGSSITLIRDLNMQSLGFYFYNTTPPQTTLKFNGAGYGETVVLDGVSFTYVGPKGSDYVFQAGEIGFTGYENGSHALNLVVGGSVPEPATGSLSLLALAALTARRRRK